MIGWRLAASVLVTLAFSACTKVETPAAGSASGHPDRLIIADASDPRNLNPALATANPVLPLSAFLFSYTVRYDEHARPVPDAVSEIPTTANGDVSRDGLTLKYKLRHGIKWHDGAELTCSDLRFTWQVMINPKNNVITTDGWKDIVGVDCRDPYVAVVHLKKIYAPFLQQLWSVNGNGPILPEHLLGKLNDDVGSLNSAPYNSAPIGSGPYKFVSWTRGSEVRLAAIDGYFLGKPKIGEVVFKIIPDQNTLATQLQTHEIDVGWDWRASSYETVRTSRGTTTIAPVIYTYDHIDFNLRRPLFADVRVRRALTFAIDRASLLAKLRHNLGELSATFLESHALSVRAGPKRHALSIRSGKAKLLLDEAGWHVGIDGIRVKNGQRLAFQLSTQTESTGGHQLQAQLQTYWRAIGAAAGDQELPDPGLFRQYQRRHSRKAGNTTWRPSLGPVPPISTAARSIRPLSSHRTAKTRCSGRMPVATQPWPTRMQTIDERRRIADYATVQHEFPSDDPSIILWFRRDVQSCTSTRCTASPRRR